MSEVFDVYSEPRRYLVRCPNCKCPVNFFIPPGSELTAKWEHDRADYYERIARRYWEEAQQLRLNNKQNT
jgi:hypothetical protein